MKKYMIFLTRRADLDREAFAQWWLTRHRLLAERLPGLRRHDFNLLPEGSPFDAVVEQWFDSEAEAMSAYDGEVGAAVAADSRANVSRRVRLEAEAYEYPLARGA